VRRRLTAFACAIAICTAGAAAAPAASFAQDPILFVHGYLESSSLWKTMISRFEKDGYPSSYLSAYTYNTSQSNKVDAEEVRSHVESLLKATGAAKVDIIAHSMGSLNSRPGPSATAPGGLRATKSSTPTRASPSAVPPTPKPPASRTRP
jgi:triacylglycerol lipase